MKYQVLWHIALPTLLAGLLAIGSLSGCGGDSGNAATPDAAATVDAPPVTPDAYQPTVHKALYYIGIDGNNTEVRELALGASASTIIYSGPNQDAGSPMMAGNKLFFTLRSQSTSAGKVWVYDPTSPKIAGINPKEAFSLGPAGIDDSPGQFAEHDGKLYFVASVSGSPHHTFVFDPAVPASASNPQKLFDVAALFPVFAAGKLIFRATAPGVGEELLAFTLAAPASASNPEVFDLIPGNRSSQPRDLVVLGGNVYFGADNELYVYNPAAASSASNPKQVIATGNSGASSLAVLGGKLYYEGSTNYSVTGSELMIYDPALAAGANNPTLAEILPGQSGASPAFFKGVGGKLAMSAYTPTNGRELYIFDPAASASNTNPALVDILPGAADSDPRSLVADGNQLYFSVNVAGTGTFMVNYDSTLPTNVTVNPRSVFMTPGEAYDFYMGSYLQ